MTREAKVGMLTGLGVIVLIGVLLSNYLDPQTRLPSGGTLGGTAANAEANATGQMAPLPAGAGFRKEVISPAAGGGGVVMAPGMGDSTQYVMAAGQTEPVGLVAGMDTNAGAAGRGPVVQDAVAPIAAGPVSAAGDTGEDGPPVVMVSQEARVSGVTVSGGAAPTEEHVTYVVVSGDTLSKIAKKFYHDTKGSDIERIVAANPGVLKDEHTTLFQGRKLTIPVIATAAARVPQPVMGGVVPMPGDGPDANGGHGKVSPVVAAAKKVNVYVVQPGDTLVKIAKRLAPANPVQMEKRLVAANGIKDRDSLEAGMKLKVPA